MSLLGAALTAIIGMQQLNGLPRLIHPPLPAAGNLSARAAIALLWASKAERELHHWIQLLRAYRDANDIDG
jgi:hypothetical protein